MKKLRGIFEKEPGSGVWSVQYFDADGNRHREKVGSRSAAIKLVQLRRTQRLEGRKLPKLRARPLLFGDLTDATLAYTLGTANHPTNVSRIKLLLSEFARSCAEEITPEEIEAWLASHTEWTLATKNRYLALLKLTFRLAEKAKRIKYNPARLVRQEKENNSRVRWLSDIEEARLRAVIQRDCPEHMPELEISINTGMRRSEQYGVAWEHVDFKNRIITIVQSKNGRTRYVQMNSRVTAILSALRDRSLGTGYIFAQRTPRSWFEPAVKAAGLKDFCWHSLRHTFISRLVMAGVDLRTVQDLAGHQSIQMTCRYAHLASGHQQTAVEKLVARSATTTATGEIEGANGGPPVVQ